MVVRGRYFDLERSAFKVPGVEIRDQVSIDLLLGMKYTRGSQYQPREVRGSTGSIVMTFLNFRNSQVPCNFISRFWITSWPSILGRIGQGPQMGDSNFSRLVEVNGVNTAMAFSQVPQTRVYY